MLLPCFQTVFAEQVSLLKVLQQKVVAFMAPVSPTLEILQHTWHSAQCTALQNLMSARVNAFNTVNGHDMLQRLHFCSYSCVGVLLQVLAPRGGMLQLLSTGTTAAAIDTVVTSAGHNATGGQHDGNTQPARRTSKRLRDDSNSDDDNDTHADAARLVNLLCALTRRGMSSCALVYAIPGRSTCFVRCD
jgi:hypothetical protein